MVFIVEYITNRTQQMLTHAQIYIFKRKWITNKYICTNFKQNKCDKSFKLVNFRDGQLQN